ncbi:hypothetical protein OC834_000993 [Tilletia horrida]|nr:hypothetical protein OC835_002328 [Tilletia horrida]KAK0536998.1 hypothetical protein OC834_000993 [Tilletia horrida]
MRQKRAKQYRRLLQQYQLHFGFRAPFQLLVDDALVLHLAKENAAATPLSRLATVLQQPADAQHVKLMITQCAMVALYNLEKKAQEGAAAGPKDGASSGAGAGRDTELVKRAIALAKVFERRRCNHREAIDAEACIAEVVGPTNKHRYILATARLKLRIGVGKETVGLPVVHPNETGVLVLAPVNDPTRAKVEEIEKAALKGPPTAPLPDNVITGPQPPAGSSSAAPASSLPPPRKRKAKGPNPLSVKKKKKSKPNAPAKRGTGQVAK